MVTSSKMVGGVLRSPGSEERRTPSPIFEDERRRTSDLFLSRLKGRVIASSSLSPYKPSIDLPNIVLQTIFRKIDLLVEIGALLRM